jgi:hypothetical protein
VTLDLKQLVLLGILSSSIHWLVARSKIAKPLWSRATGWLADLLVCPSCSGFWIGWALGLIGLHPVHTGIGLADLACTPVLAIFLTPVFEGLLLWGLLTSALGTSHDEELQNALTDYDESVGTWLGGLENSLNARGVDPAVVQQVVQLTEDFMHHRKPTKEPDA